MRIARVFPRRTKASPDDPLAFFGSPGLFPPEVDKVHISISFTWDKSIGERLADEWSRVAPTTIGGPAYNNPSSEFIPGRYLRNGYIITSRGCPNKCWYCSVWRHEPKLIELPIRDGWILQDDNILACSYKHIRDVFSMLKKQPVRAQLMGLEARLFKSWHAELVRDLNPLQIFFAFDKKSDKDPLVDAINLLQDIELIQPQRKLVRVYVLIGYPGDTIEKAEDRLNFVLKLGAWPFPQAYRGEDGKRTPEWMRFQRLWSRMPILYTKMKEMRQGI